MSQSPKIAIVITVKNEERLLKQNLLYHFGIGISHAFIYFDGTTDGGPKSIEDMGNVLIQSSVTPDLYRHLTFLDKFTSNARKHHTARQCLNTYDAMLKSKAEGIDWLISIDADELFYTGNDKHISDFFSDLSDYDVIMLRPLEVVNRKLNYENVMKEEVLFKTQKNFSSKVDQIYFNVENPYSKSKITSSFWLGHTMGKCALNVQKDLIPHNVHRFKLKNSKTVNKVNRGFILHYHMYDFNDFIKKFKNFKNRPSSFLSGNDIGTLKSLWIKLVNDSQFTPEDLKEYYIDNILFTDVKISKLKKTRLFNILSRKEKATVEITLPSEILSKLEPKT
jgi:hypothetical protein